MPYYRADTIYEANRLFPTTCIIASNIVLQSQHIHTKASVDNYYNQACFITIYECLHIYLTHRYSDVLPRLAIAVSGKVIYE